MSNAKFLLQPAKGKYKIYYASSAERGYTFEVGKSVKTDSSICRAAPGQCPMALPSTALKASTPHHTIPPRENGKEYQFHRAVRRPLLSEFKNSSRLLYYCCTLWYANPRNARSSGSIYSMPCSFLLFHHFSRTLGRHECTGLQSFNWNRFALNLFSSTGCSNRLP